MGAGTGLVDHRRVSLKTPSRNRSDVGVQLHSVQRLPNTSRPVLGMHRCTQNDPSKHLGAENERYQSMVGPSLVVSSVEDWNMWRSIEKTRYRLRLTFILPNAAHQSDTGIRRGRLETSYPPMVTSEEQNPLGGVEYKLYAGGRDRA